MRKDKLVFIAVVVGVFALAATALALRWEDLVESGVFDQRPAPSAPPSPAGDDPNDHSIYSLVPNGLSCASPNSEIQRNEIEPGTDPNDALREITASVEELREVAFEDEVPSEFLDAAEFEELIERKLEKNSAPIEEATALSKLYQMLGAIDPGVDLQDELNKFYTDQITGLYLPNKGRLIVSDEGSGFSAGEESVLAHELDHALTDQAIGLPKLGRIFREDEDKAGAVQALVEGDATLLQLQYTSSVMSVERLGELQEEFANPPETPSAPYIVEKSVGFPYDEGMRFACYLFSNGGWEAVEEAYENPPQATADILFPHRYEEGITPKDPTNPSSPGKGWKRTLGSTFGAAELLFLIQAPGGDPMGSPGDLAGDVLGWNGGEYSIFENEKTQDVAAYVGLVNGGEDTFPEGANPNSLSAVLKSWILMNWPDLRPEAAEGLGGAWTWTHGDTTYVFSGREKKVGLAAGPDFKTAASLLPK